MAAEFSAALILLICSFISWRPQVPPPKKNDGVADGIRTRNNQNHNLGLYH